MTPNEAITTLNALFNHEATEIHCVVSNFITGKVNGTMRESRTVAIGSNPTYPEQAAIIALCELFPGGPSFVSELHLEQGGPVRAMVQLQDENGKKYIRYPNCKSEAPWNVCNDCKVKGETCSEVAAEFMDAEYVWELA
jgi:hypothetical protein